MENVQKVTWFGQEVTNSAEVPFGSIGAMLPHFERRAFGVNPYSRHDHQEALQE